MINNAWPLCPLGELFEIGAGKTMSAAGREGEDKTPFLRTSNVLWDEIDLNTLDEMAIPKHELPAKRLRAGDLLVCEGGEVGRAAIWNGELEVMSFQNHLHRLMPLVDNVEPRFYVYFLQSAFTQLGIFEGAANKTTIPNLSRNRLAALDVPHPRLDEPRAIVAALARIREAMRVHDRSTELAQELKCSAMRELFTRGLRGEAQKETEIGPVPESWKVVEFGSIFTNFDGLRVPVKQANRQSGPYPYYGASGVVDYVQGYLFHGDYLLISEDGENLASRRLPIAFRANGKFWVNNHAHVVKPYRGSLAFYARYIAQANIRDYLTGTTRPKLTKGLMMAMRLPFPAESEQHDIAYILDAIDGKVDLHRKKRAVLDELFKALLYKLMTARSGSPISICRRSTHPHPSCPDLFRASTRRAVRRLPWMAGLIPGSSPGTTMMIKVVPLPQRRPPNEPAEDQRGGVKESWQHDRPHPISGGKRSLFQQREQTGCGRTIMSVTIDLPPDIEANLAAQAAAEGVPLAEHLRRLLVAQASGSGARETPAERVKLWRDVSGLPDIKPLSDEAISRESIYSEREENGALAAELLALGRDCAARLKEPWRSADHAELLYDERGLPR